MSSSSSAFSQLVIHSVTVLAALANAYVLTYARRCIAPDSSKRTAVVMLLLLSLALAGYNAFLVVDDARRLDASL